TNSAASYRLRGNRLLAELVYWRKLLLAISADMTPSAAAKKRRFCRLRPRGAPSARMPGNFRGHDSVGRRQKASFLSAAPAGAPSARMPGNFRGHDSVGRRQKASFLSAAPAG